MNLFNLLSITFLLGAAPYIEALNISRNALTRESKSLMVREFETQKAALIPQEVEIQDQQDLNYKTVKSFVTLNLAL